MRYPNNPILHVLDPLATVSDAGLSSGCWVETIQPSQADASDVFLYQRAATASILRGPQAGQQFALVTGPNVVGRGRGCRIQLIDETVSRAHATIDIGAAITVTNLDSGNGLYIDERRAVSGPVTAANVISVGDTVLVVAREPVHAGLAPAARPEAVVEFARSPRVDVRFGAQKLAAPVPPQRLEPQKFPIQRTLVRGRAAFHHCSAVWPALAGRPRPGLLRELRQPL